jgi:hypothetical protein
LICANIRFFNRIRGAAFLLLVRNNPAERDGSAGGFSDGEGLPDAQRTAASSRKKL